MIPDTVGRGYESVGRDPRLGVTCATLKGSPEFSRIDQYVHISDFFFRLCTEIFYCLL